MKILRTLGLLCIISVLSGCTEMNFHSFGTKPSSFMMEMPENAGPEIYRQGYKDGCESGYSGYANSFNKVFYSWRQDPELAQNPVYYQIWKDAYAYCANYGMMVDSHGLGNWR
jgi:hypothetical protein